MAFTPTAAPTPAEFAIHGSVCAALEILETLDRHDQLCQEDPRLCLTHAELSFEFNGKLQTIRNHRTTIDAVEAYRKGERRYGD